MWRRIGIAGCSGLLLAGVVFLVLRNDEPSYQGRRISLILDDWVADKPDVPVGEALSKIGTNALPYVVSNLARSDSIWRKKYRYTWPKLPKFLQKILPKPKTALQTADGASVFGYVGPTALPQAIGYLKHDSSGVRQAAAWGLGSGRWDVGCKLFVVRAACCGCRRRPGGKAGASSPHSKRFARFEATGRIYKARIFPSRVARSFKPSGVSPPPCSVMAQP